MTDQTGPELALAVALAMGATMDPTRPESERQFVRRDGLVMHCPDEPDREYAWRPDLPGADFAEAMTWLIHELADVGYGLHVHRRGGQWHASGIRLMGYGGGWDGRVTAAGNTIEEAVCRAVVAWSADDP